jgi:hypothetical protein
MIEGPKTKKKTKKRKEKRVKERWKKFGAETLSGPL